MNSKKTKAPAIDIGIIGGDRTARVLLPVVDAANDSPTADLLTQRLEVREEMAWMLRSRLEHGSECGRRLAWVGKRSRSFTPT